MATTKKNTDAAAPERVWLRCEEAGKTRDFDPAHAQRLLDVQQQLGITGDKAWQPAEAPTPDA